MEEQAREDLDEPELRRRADLRYRGQSFELTVDADDLGAARRALRTRRTSAATATGWTSEPVELVNARVVATVPVEKPELRRGRADGRRRGRRRARANFDGDWSEAPVLRPRAAWARARASRARRSSSSPRRLRRAARLGGRGRRRRARWCWSASE